MKTVGILLTLILVVLGAVATYGTAQAQDEPITLTLRKAVEGVDPEPTGSDFSFTAPSFGSDFVLKPGGSIFIEVASTHTFTMTEAEQAGWEFVSAVCTGTTDVSVDGASLQATAQGNDVTCTFTSRAVNPAPVNLTITKSVVGVDPMPGGTPFDFTANGASNTLRNGESFSVTYVPPTIIVREVPQVGWAITGFECAGAFDVVSSALLQAHTIIASPGADVSCTFVNEPVIPAVVTVIKKVDGVNPTNPTFNFTVDGRTPFELAEDETAQIELNQGTHTIAETPLAGWQTPVITCGDQAPVTANEIVLTLAGGAVECTFVNRPDVTDLLGDVTCDGVVNILDAFATSQYVVQLRTGVSGCPLASPLEQINLDAVSVGGANVTILDAFRISQCVVGLSNQLCPVAN